ncbi:SNF2 family N-terminal domain-containing protein [Cristinia sonorae]|uniref:SNF2 family N-terminal domain-containing protein n=1 Tax=Cristinia sonorae TaxID=1940300 RepID=A0A8K0XP22_9AGAR|nr:SNF2 family N-terminal domain-containing protein [Cristinia sonorae]
MDMKQEAPLESIPTAPKCGFNGSPVLPSQLADHLDQLLAAGTVNIHLQDLQEDIQTGHPALLPLPSEVNPVSGVDIQLLDDLHYFAGEGLVACQTYIRRSSRGNGTTLVIRVYLVPHDLPLLVDIKLSEKARVARHSFRSLLSRIMRNTHEWSHPEEEILQDDGAAPIIEPFYPEETDVRTMGDLYSSLESPNPPDPPVNIDNISVNGRLHGMRTTLYAYQRRSVKAMLCRELCSSPVPSPLYIALNGPGLGGNSVTCYFQPATMELLKERPMVSPSKGGILCEELGTGKTVMILALIVATLDQLPTAQSSPDAAPQSVLTPLSIRGFCRAEDERARSLGLSREGAPTTIPTLRELLIHQCRVLPTSRSTVRFMKSLPRGVRKDVAYGIANNVPFFLHSAVEGDIASDSRPKTRAYEKSRAEPPRPLFLSSATLVIVPSNLLHQWQSEILKHCQDSIKVLLLSDDSNRELPRTVELATDYDIILMSHMRFAKEEQKSRPGKLNRVCRCPHVSTHIRVPLCVCDWKSAVSPFLSIRWKRIVVDEGHKAHNRTSNLTTFARRLSVERRWIVTGTPTTHLMGLQFGQNGEKDNSELSQLVDASTDLDLKPSNLTVIPGEEQHCEVLKGRIWSHDGDREDLNKLYRMIGHFLMIKPFAVTTESVENSRIFSTHVMDALIPGPRMLPRPGSIRMLQQIMEMVMIRHRCEDIEKDIVLPSMKHETVLLDLDHFAAISYNVIQARLAVNTISSERHGKDYVFHPSNQMYLQQTVVTMSQAMFWIADDLEFLYKLDQTVSSSDEVRRKASMSIALSESDHKLLDDALRIVSNAANNALWRGMVNHPDIYHQVTGLPMEVYKAWTDLNDRTSGDPHVQQSSGRPAYFVSCARLLSLRNLFAKHLNHGNSPTIPQVVEWGSLVSEMEDLKYEVYLSQIHSKKTMRRQLLSSESSKEAWREKMTKRNGSELKFLHHDLLRAQMAMNDIQSTDRLGAPVGATYRSQSDGPSANPLADVRIGNSMSSKLNFILQEIMQYAPEDKFLVFSYSPMSLAYIAESLELLEVKHILLAPTTHVRLREQMILTFETSDTDRVLLMELKHGARGLNITSANRVIFCEPVWKGDEEAQAIKRVHRIGQKKSVIVKTLAIRNTFEEYVRDTDYSYPAPNGSAITAGEIRAKQLVADALRNPTFLPLPGLDTSGKTASFEVPFMRHSNMEASLPSGIDNTQVAGPSVLDPGEDSEAEVIETPVVVIQVCFTVRAKLRRAIYPNLDVKLKFRDWR